MAMRTGIEESRTQTWFEKQKILRPVHREEPVNLSDDTNERQWQYVNLATPQVSCPPFSNPSYHDHPSLPSPLRSQAFVPWDSCGIFGRQVPQAVQRRQTPDTPLTYTDHSMEQPIAGQGFSDTLPPFCPPPDAEHEKGHSGDLDNIDHIPSIMQWWDKSHLDLIARWNPLKKT